jgi:hypothetical protein
MTTDEIDIIAQVCHEANRAYALATGEQLTQVHPSWAQAPEEIRLSARIGVRAALDGATPRELHESWCTSKRDAGWTYGAVRDNTAKVHPCLVAYHELPAVQRRKDALFHAIVNALKEA